MKTTCWRCGLTFRCVTAEESAGLERRYLELIPAIKARRAATGEGLKEAKEAAEREFLDAAAALLDLPADQVTWRHPAFRTETEGRGPMFWCPACSARIWPES